MVTIRTVSFGAFRGSMSQAEYVRRMSQLHAPALKTRDMFEKTSAFWRMENLSSEFLKQRQSGQSLCDPDLPIEIRPISHCGMGIAAVEVAEFDPGRITSTVDGFSDPRYRLFGYEGSGAMLAVYEPDLFGLMSRAIGKLGILPLAPLKKPATGAFLGHFSPEIRRLIAHGYGRLQYFKNNSIVSAVRAVARAAELEYHAGVQGIAFAYAMVNNTDLDRVFRAGEHTADAATAAAFRDGLTYALEFWEWMAPGFLDMFAARTPYQRELAATARREIQEDRARGCMAAFAVGQQREKQVTNHE